ncbi:hypothetical protein Y032_0084g1767 [Ancylostoma ceylanicum]|uniref:Uncharacterized protein n=1 Tax=Ancylostoma ceylanicum TaxID=53326 RepID=A0A016TR33_9BILA|nr:hypothetical protein Y032_0084g1767 [Ancylostoma ceylanicum]
MSESLLQALRVRDGFILADAPENVANYGGWWRLRLLDLSECAINAVVQWNVFIVLYKRESERGEKRVPVAAYSIILTSEYHRKDRTGQSRPLPHKVRRGL